jgi:hypothetical protein
VCVQCVAVCVWLCVAVCVQCMAVCGCVCSMCGCVCSMCGCVCGCVFNVWLCVAVCGCVSEMAVSELPSTAQPLQQPPKVSLRDQLMHIVSGPTPPPAGVRLPVHLPPQLAPPSTHPATWSRTSSSCLHVITGGGGPGRRKRCHPLCPLSVVLLFCSTRFHCQHWQQCLCGRCTQVRHQSLPVPSVFFLFLPRPWLTSQRRKVLCVCRLCMTVPQAGHCVSHTWASWCW